MTSSAVDGGNRASRTWDVVLMTCLLGAIVLLWILVAVATYQASP